jgi:hypothetical protein
MQTGKMKRMALARGIQGEPEAEPAAEEAAEKTIKHVGGGVYELPNGEKIKGKAKAEAALAAL